MAMWKCRRLYLKALCFTILWSTFAFALWFLERVIDIRGLVNGYLLLVEPYRSLVVQLAGPTLAGLVLALLVWKALGLAKRIDYLLDPDFIYLPQPSRKVIDYNCERPHLVGEPPNWKLSGSSSKAMNKLPGGGSLLLEGWARAD